MSTIAIEQEINFEFTSFLVGGNNWTTEVKVNAEDYSGIEDIIIEAATLGVEKFMEGNYNQINFDKNVGYGAVILVSNEEIRTAVPTDIILANAAKHKDAAEIKKMIDKRKNGE
jgi:hypothetical protein